MRHFASKGVGSKKVVKLQSSLEYAPLPGATGILDAARVWLRTFSDSNRSTQGVVLREEGPEEDEGLSVSPLSVGPRGKLMSHKDSLFIH